MHRIIQFFNTKSLHWAANYPKAWTYGWLTQLCIAVVLYTLSAILALILPVETTNTPIVLMWYGLGFIPASFWWIFIIYRLVKFNTDKLYGNRTFAQNFSEIPTYIGQFILPYFIPLILASILILRIGNLRNLKELSLGKIAIEEAQPFFTMNYGEINFYRYSNYDNLASKTPISGDYYFDYYTNDSICLLDLKSKSDWQNRNSNNSYEYQAIEEDIHQPKRIEYGNEIIKDSILGQRGIFEESRPMLYRINNDNKHYSIGEIRSEFSKKCNTGFCSDSLTTLYFLAHYRNDSFIKKKFESLRNRMKSFGYSESKLLTSDELLSFFKNHDYRISTQHPLINKVEVFNESMDNFESQTKYIIECNHWDFKVISEWEIHAIFLLFFASLAIVFSLFKNMAWYEFLIGIFIITVIGILTGIIGAINRVNAPVGFLIVWGEFIVLFIWSLMELQSPIRRKRGAVLFMIPHLSLAVIPLATLGTLDVMLDFWHWSYFNQFLEFRPTENNPFNMGYNDTYKLIKRWTPAAVTFIGYFLYIFVWYPLWIKPNWLAFMSKPKKS